ncbi:MAG: J domain-containing protein [Nitrospiraceae bacterium]|nr:J domain-containing protein [Nitrospira sp.]MCB9772718.1 J domain-containing protein [Nitrospiraceae bacterium]
MASAQRDLYDILGVKKTVDAKELKKAYRRLARQYHPDLHPGEKKTEMERKFKELNEAYEVLGDEEKRKKYDQYGMNWKEAEAYERARQQGGGAYPGGGPGGFTQGGADFSDIFESMFRQGAQREGAGFRGFAMAGADLEANLPISLREAFTGTRRALNLSDAGGTPRSIEVRIPAGVRDGERLRVKGKGAPGRGGGPPGDLFFHVQIAPHPVFQRKDSDIVVTLPLWPWEAVLGTDIPVPTLSGTVRLKIPAGSQSQQRMRLKGKGLPKRTGGHGDQFVILDIVTPEAPSSEEQQLYEQLAKFDHPDPRSTLLREAANE